MHCNMFQAVQISYHQVGVENTKKNIKAERRLFRVVSDKRLVYLIFMVVFGRIINTLHWPLTWDSTSDK